MLDCECFQGKIPILRTVLVKYAQTAVTNRPLRPNYYVDLKLVILYVNLTATHNRISCLT